MYPEIASFTPLRPSKSASTHQKQPPATTIFFVSARDEPHQYEERVKKTKILKKN